MSPTAIVTGVNGGIGGAVVERLAAAGWQVHGTDRQPDTDASVSRYARADLQDAETAASLVEELARDDAVAALVNIAAEQIMSRLEDLSAADWDRGFAVNARAPFLLMQSVWPRMRGEGGAIVNISSVHARATSPGMACYASTKAALVALTRGAALEWGPDGIRVNAVLPGAIDTPMLRSHLEDGALADLAGKHAVGRVGTPRDVAEAVLYLVDDVRAGFITGQTFIVDGGALSRLPTE